MTIASAAAMLKILQRYVVWLWIIQVSSLVSHNFYSYHAVRRCIFHYTNEKLGFIEQLSWNDHHFDLFTWGHFFFPGQLPWAIRSSKMTEFYDGDYAFKRVTGHQFIKLYILMFEKWLSVTAMAGGGEKMRSVHACDVSLGARIVKGMILTNFP